MRAWRGFQGLESEKQGRRGLAHPQRKQRAGEHSGPQQEQGFAQDQPDDAAAIGPERHADADFVASDSTATVVKQDWYEAGEPRNAVLTGRGEALRRSMRKIPFCNATTDERAVRLAKPGQIGVRDIKVGESRHSTSVVSGLPPQTADESQSGELPNNLRNGC